MGKRRLKSCVAKRITSILLAAAMAVSTPIGTLFNANSVVKAAETGINIVNGNFEGDIWSDDASINGWTPTMNEWGNETDGKNTLKTQTYAGNDSWLLIPESSSTAGVYYYISKLSESTENAVITMSQEIDIPKGKYDFTVDAYGSNSTIAVSLVKDNSILASSDSQALNSESYTDTSLEYYTDTALTDVVLTVTVTVSAIGSSGVVNSVVAEGKLINGDFSTENLGWTIEDDNGLVSYSTNTNNSSQAIKINNYDLHATSDVKISQEIYNAKAGKYKLTFNMSGDADLTFPLTAEIFINDAVEPIAESTSKQTTGWANWEPNETSSFTVEDGDIIKVVFESTVPDQFYCLLDDVVIEPDTANPVDSTIYVNKVKIDDDFITGFDISSYLSIKESGATYKDADGKELSDKEFFDLLKNSGVNWVRIRVWVDPTENGKTYGGGHNDLATAKTIGKLATDSGLRVLIDFHYSDFWTNPGKQSAPKAWKNMTLTDKATALSTYTTTSLTELKNAGVDVGMVQIGNETNDGFCGEKAYDEDGNFDMTNMCTLFAAGCNAVRNFDPNILIAIHVADPQSLDFSNYAKQLYDNSVDYDVFASSYYPYWHGTLDNLKSKLAAVATTYNKKVMVAETSYLHTLEDGDGHENTESESKLSTDTFPYPIGLQGQALHVRSVVNTVASIEQGIGVFYWEPAWIPVGHYDADADNAAAVLASNREKWEEFGSGWATSAAADYDKNVGEWYGGSAVDNEGVFDFDGKALPTLEIYNMIRYGTTAADYAVAAVDVSTEIDLGDEIEAPDSVKIVMASGAKNDADSLNWDEEAIAEAFEAGVGEYSISGTAQYNGEPFDVTWTLTIKAYNYLVNPSFESGNTSWDIVNESNEETAKSRITNSSGEVAHNGNYKYHFYNTSDFELGFSQTVTLEPGVYNFGGYIQGGDMGDNADVYFYVDIDGEVTKDSVTLTGWKEWKNGNIEFEITEAADVTVGMYIAGAGGGWGTADDFYINKTGDIEDTDDNTGDDNTDDNTDKDNPDDSTDKDTTDDGTDKDTTDDGTDKDNPDDNTDKDNPDDNTDKDVKDDSTDKDSTDKDNKDDAKVEDKKDDTKVEDKKDIPEGEKFANYQSCDFYEDEDGNITCYDSKGKQVIDDFKCDGEFTYYFQFDGTAMKDRLTYHPDGIHVIYFDENGHEVFNDFAHVKRSIAGEEVDDYCFFDVFGYLYVDVITWDKTGTVLYYANPYGVLEMGKWFQFSDTVKWGDGRETEGIAGGYGYATEDGTLMTNQFTYDWEGNFCYMQGNGTILR